jgi:hypothetical protein
LKERRIEQKKKHRKDKELAVKRSSRKKATAKESSKNKVVINLFGQKKAPKVSESIESESSEIESEEDVECLYCGGTDLSSKKGEGWARCKQCCRWAHEDCAGTGEDDDFI